jgi:hypothetical protein
LELFPIFKAPKSVTIVKLQEMQSDQMTENNFQSCIK